MPEAQARPHSPQETPVHKRRGRRLSRWFSDDGESECSTDNFNTSTNNSPLSISRASSPEELTTVIHSFLVYVTASKEDLQKGLAFQNGGAEPERVRLCQTPITQGYGSDQGTLAKHSEGVDALREEMRQFSDTLCEKWVSLKRSGATKMGILEGLRSSFSRYEEEARRRLSNRVELGDIILEFVEVCTKEEYNAYLDDLQRQSGALAR